MAESIKLLKVVEQFILNKCTHKKEKKNSFEIYYHPNENNNLSLIYDSTHYIPCVFTQKKEFGELNKIKDDSYLLIKDSNLDLVFYKSDSEPKFIKSNIIIIINDFSILEKPKIEGGDTLSLDKEKIFDINKENRVIKKLGIFLYDYIKKIFSKNKNLILNNLFLENAKYNIKLFNNDSSKIENIEFVKNLEAEIKMKEGKNIEDILDELNPEIKENLIAKYIDEMPDDIVNLQKKYKKINFTKEIYQNYLKDFNFKEKEKEN
jgi:hypothetical protein